MVRDDIIMRRYNQMKWQEYQEAVSEFYKEAEGIGNVRNNIMLPDKVTGQPRQIDCLLEADVKGHKITVLIDAKYHENKLDVNDIEVVSALAQSVGADKAVIVCANGWTEPAGIKAKFNRLDLRLWPAEEAVRYLNPDFWMMCPLCGDGLIIMDGAGAAELSLNLISWWVAGRCDKCRGGVVWCADCGEKFAAEYGKTHWCGCGHMWRFGKDVLQFYPKR